jgi:hypothetical protein
MLRMADLREDREYSTGWMIWWQSRIKLDANARQVQPEWAAELSADPERPHHPATQRMFGKRLPHTMLTELLCLFVVCVSVALTAVPTIALRTESFSESPTEQIVSGLASDSKKS